MGRIGQSATRRRLVEPMRRDLDGLAHGAEDLAHLSAQEDQSNDRDDRDQGENERVFGKALTATIRHVSAEEVRDPNVGSEHWLTPGR